MHKPTQTAWLKKLKNNWLTVTLIFCGVAVAFAYAHYTDFATRTFDLNAGGHLDYIVYMAHKWVPPNPDIGWEYYQPPLYYVLAAVVYLSSLSIGVVPFVSLQYFSIVLYLYFLIFGVLIIHALVKEKKLEILAVFLLTVWPSGIIHSVRIGNDMSVYLFSTAALYFLIMWEKSGKEKDFNGLCISTVLSVFSKFNGFIIAFVGLIVMFKSLVIKKQTDISHFLLYILTVAASFAVMFYTKIERFLSGGRTGDVLIGNAIGITNPGLLVQNKPVNYVVFDFLTFIKQPFTSTWKDWGGRQYFWNFFLKSSLFSEFSFPLKSQQIIATIMSVLLLIAIGYVLTGFCIRKKKSRVNIHTTLVVHLIVSLLAVIALRIRYPYADSADFRFIYPCIIPAIYLFTESVRIYKERGITMMKMVGYGIGYVTGILSVIFFILPLFIT